MKSFKTISIKNSFFLLQYLGSNCDITEAFFVPEVLEGGDHVGLEVVPPEAELLVVSHGGLLGFI